jgi:uncharacterized phage protein (TIGR02220 family)
VSDSPSSNPDGAAPSGVPAVPEEPPMGPPVKGLHPDAIRVLRLFNTITDHDFRAVSSNMKMISARLRETNGAVGEIEKMIRRQTLLWSGTAMAKYLRIETLFNATKFQSYYEQRSLPAAREGVPVQGISSEKNNPPPTAAQLKAAAAAYEQLKNDDR